MGPERGRQKVTRLLEQPLSTGQSSKLFVVGQADLHVQLVELDLRGNITKPADSWGRKEDLSVVTRRLRSSFA